MGPTLESTVGEHADTLADHGTRIALLEQTTGNHGESIRELEANQAAIRELLSKTATRDDVNKVLDKLHDGLFNLLPQAMNTFPSVAVERMRKEQREEKTVKWQVWAAVAAIGLVLVGVAGIIADAAHLH